MITTVTGWVDGALCAWHAVKCEKCGLRTQESEARYVIETVNGNILCQKDGRKEVIDKWNRRESEKEGHFDETR